ncbi:4-hydroxyphenylacetate 3-hydroxylase N-terminal domain-containing protein [Sorangium sp. So ce1128]
MHAEAMSVGVKAQPAAPTLPMTGQEYLDSLRDDREIWIYGERVKDVTTHPAFRNSARMMARLYDGLHDPATKGVLTCATDTGNGGFTHRFFKAPTDIKDLVAARDAIAAWQRMVYGWMGRSPDYKAAFLGMMGVGAHLFAPYQENAQRWYKRAQERVLHMNHAVVHPPVDRGRPADEVEDVFVHVEKETDAGLIVSGAKVVATGAALTNYCFVAHMGQPMNKKEFSVVFIAPMGAPGVKLLARSSYEMTAAVMGSPFDYPLSSRFDENDSILVFDKALIPWENVLIYADPDKSNNIIVRSGFLHRYPLHGCTRLAVKLDFIAGLLLMAVKATGAAGFHGVRTNVGEVIAWRNVFWALTDAMARTPATSIGHAPLPAMSHGTAYRMLATVAYPRIKEIIEQVVASGLIYVNSHTVDFGVPEIRAYIDKYIRGSNGMVAVDRVKLMKLLWDAIGTEFGGRHELYERNYAGNHEIIRQHALIAAEADGQAEQYRGFAERCMAEYDLGGWTVPDLINPDDVNLISRSLARRGR